ncbi:MAG: 1-acyl-sn-glycerol-3-phosphate acyltransferase [Bacteroidales bacterium]|jgi:glycerol-3-phosphate O-acyltransferase
MTINTFDDIRPYYDSEINEAMLRIADDPLFDNIARYLYPDGNIEEVKNNLRKINTTHDFQVQFMDYAIKKIVELTINKYTAEGFEKLDKNKSYLFVSNHRDILLDSALLQIALHENGLKTSEITFGSNLMNPQLAVDIGKSNKMFKVKRSGTPREFYYNTLELSKYIRYTILDKDESVWIAQRNGRTKNGNDKTDQGLIKMFASSANNTEELLQLNITPVTISYQWETCDIEKVYENFVNLTGKYEKKPGEDMNSVIKGITQYKGNVHINIGDTITRENYELEGVLAKDINRIVEIIDNDVHKNYKLWDNNYIAHDLINNKNTYLDVKYNSGDRQKFVDKMNEKISAIKTDDTDTLVNLYLEIYSNPVVNKLSKL